MKRLSFFPLRDAAPASAAPVNLKSTNPSGLHRKLFIIVEVAVPVVCSVMCVVVRGVVSVYGMCF